MENTVAIITGASQGIGRSTAIRLARDFSGVVLVARNADALKLTADAARAAGSTPMTLALDLRERTAAEQVIKETISLFGRIDALVNIAGAVPQVELLDVTDAQWEDGLALKLHGARRLTVKAWPHLKASRGSVVFTSGNSATVPKSAQGAVGPINAAIVALAKAFSEQGIGDGVQVNSVLPGPVMTGRRESFLRQYAPSHGMTYDEAVAQFPRKANIARYGKPEEIAELMAFLVSPGAKWLTGSALRMDGGEVKAV